MHQLHQCPYEPAGGHDGQVQHGLLDVGVLVGRWQLGGAVDLDDFAAIQGNLVGHAWSGDDQIEIVFALKTFLHNFKMHQPEKAATESEPKSCAVLRLNGQRGVIQL